MPTQKNDPSAHKPPLKILFLFGADNASARKAFEAVCALSSVRPVAILLDTRRGGFMGRLKSLLNAVRTGGLQRIASLATSALRSVTDSLCEKAVVSPAHVNALLRSALPAACYSVRELADKHALTLLRLDHLDTVATREALKTLDADLGVILGATLPQEQLFQIPRIGWASVEEGEAADYQGWPTGSWELFHGAAASRVTIRLNDVVRGPGSIVAECQVPIAPIDTPEILAEKLRREGARLLALAITRLDDQTVDPKSSYPEKHGTWTRPTRRQIRELRQRLPHWAYRPDSWLLLRNLYALIVYYSGIYAVFRAWHRLAKARACILLYHRVNDYSKDSLTVDPHTFAAQMSAVASRYATIRTIDLVNRIKSGSSFTGTAVTVHFDDCYRDVVLTAGPILKAVGMPATAFINSGFIGTDRIFPHDVQRSPFHYPNMRAEDVAAWVENGFEIGAHTVNHADLGSCTTEEARLEILDSRTQLESFLTEKEEPVTLFSFPFGRPKNIKPQALAIIRDEFAAVFSAAGGFVGPHADPYNIPRMPGTGDYNPLSLLLQIEGLSPKYILSRLKARLARHE